MKTKIKDYTAVALLVVSAILLICFDVFNIYFSEDGELNILLKELIPRVIVGVIFAVIIVLLGDKQILIPKFRRLHKDLLWCVPCFLVVLANFPFSALIIGTAQVERVDLIWLLLLKCLAVGLMEETLFRGLVQPLIYQGFCKKPYGKLITVAITSAIFALFHFLNLFSGAGILATFMQVGYSFLIGAMLSAVVIKTQNLPLCILIHALFNFGGDLIPYLGRGVFQDACFWALTAFCGVICFAHILYYLLKNKGAGN